MLQRRGRPLDRVEAERLLARVVDLYGALESADLTVGGTRANLAATCDLVERIRTQPSSALQASFLRSSLLRRLGRTSEAIDEARRAFTDTPSWISATALAASYRDHGEPDLAMEYYRHAAALDRSDESVWVDMGDVLCSQGRWREAVQAYEEALARKPGHVPARVGATYARFRAGDDEAGRTLERLVRQDGEVGLLARRRLAAETYAQELRRDS